MIEFSVTLLNSSSVNLQVTNIKTTINILDDKNQDLKRFQKARMIV